MLMKNAFIALAVLLSVQVNAKTDTGQNLESSEERELADRQAVCGNNILCYFSPQEVRDGLGPALFFQGIEDNFRIDAGEADYSAEQLFDIDGNAVVEANDSIITDFSGLRRRARASSKKSSTPNMSKMSGGSSFKGISPIGAPIWPSFVAKFRQCAKGCIPYIVSVKREGAVSCHSGGRAIDVGGLVCGGTTHMAINRGRYDSFVSCMKGKMKTLYRNGPGITAGHHDHAHFSNGCTVSGGRRWY